MRSHSISRRRALTVFGLLAGAPSVARGQGHPGEVPRPGSMDELVNVPEFEDMARLKLDAATNAAIAGGDRTAFDRITLRPRMLVPSGGLDLTVEMFGERMFAPIVVGPMADQRQFHPEGELATSRGASAARAVMVVSSRSSEGIERIAAQGKTTLWYQIYSERTNAVRTQVQQAVSAGCKALVISVGTRPSDASGRPDWRAIDALRQGITVPVVIKGVMSPEDAASAVKRGIQGIVVSNGGKPDAGRMPVDVLPSIVDAVGREVPVLVDGSFRRGTDVIKALALGARAVLVGRPVMWGLAAYGADGVRGVVEILQTELARAMVNVSKPTIKMLDRTLVKIHDQRTS